MSPFCALPSSCMRFRKYWWNSKPEGKINHFLSFSFLGIQPSICINARFSSHTEHYYIFSTAQSYIAGCVPNFLLLDVFKLTD